MNAYQNQDEFDDNAQISALPKRNVFRRMFDFFGSLSRKRRALTFSRFYYLVEGLEKKHGEYSDAHTAVKLCDEAISIIGQRISLIDQAKAVNQTLLEHACYDKITDEESKDLKELMARLKALYRDKSDLKNQITGLDPALARLAELEEEAQHIMPEIKQAEQHQRAFKQDMHYLRGEKSELEYERESLVKGSGFIQKFMIGVVIVFVLSTLIMGFSAVSFGTVIAVPLTIMTVMAVAITALLFGFQRRIKYELDLNTKKQQKAVGMLNRKSAVFAHYTNFLNFTYKKYKVRNADMLKKHLKDYEHYKHLTRRFDAIRKMADQTEKEINTFISFHKIPVGTMSLENFAKTFNLDEKRDIYGTSVKQKNILDRDLRTLDERQERLWDEIVDLNRLEGGVVDNIINAYIEEAGKIILNPIYLQSEQAELRDDFAAKNNYDKITPISNLQAQKNEELIPFPKPLAAGQKDASAVREKAVNLQGQPLQDLAAAKLKRDQDAALEKLGLPGVPETRPSVKDIVSMAQEDAAVYAPQKEKEEKTQPFIPRGKKKKNSGDRGDFWGATEEEVKPRPEPVLKDAPIDKKGKKTKYKIFIDNEEHHI